ncbi:MAG: hypothetical protein NTV79_07195 [Candidatus Aureabacteria bacterium]|nr:hypothetical protein [Candidatus Auribacterota bacterium]
MHNGRTALLPRRRRMNLSFREGRRRTSRARQKTARIRQRPGTENQPR